MNRGYRRTLILVLGICLPAGVFADTEVTRIAIDPVPDGTVGLGFGYRFTTSPYIDDDDYIDLVPMYIYDGRFLFAHGTSAGIHLINNDSFVVDLLARYRFDRLDPRDSDFLRSVEKRDQTVDGGIGATWRGDWGWLRGDFVTDMLDEHNGQEATLNYRYPFRFGKWMISPFLGLQHQDEDLTNSYYGVSDAESRPDLPVYVADQATNIRYGFNVSYFLTDRWVLYGNVAFTHFDDSIADSPLVKDDQVADLFLGAAFNFGNVFDSPFVEPERRGEWSWRVNYGYNAEYTFNRVARGYLAPNDEIDTRLAGLTLGRLLSSSHRIDWYGRFATYRHFQRDFQDDFWEFDLFVTAMGKAYMPWSDDLMFRYGFGAGLSYAQSVPIDEQIAQAERDRETAQFLNYLEFQIDFPIDHFFKREEPSNCFTGLTVVHRSGVFASSDLLGNVDGGSNVISFHLECLR